MGDPDIRTFRNWDAIVMLGAGVILFVVFAIFGAPLFFIPAALCLPLLVFAHRQRVVVRGAEVELRSALQSRRISLHQITAIRVRVSIVASAGWQLRLYYAGGHLDTFTTPSFSNWRLLQGEYDYPPRDAPGQIDQLHHFLLARRAAAVTP